MWLSPEMSRCSMAVLLFQFRMGADEILDVLPRVGRGVLELRVLSVEEAMGSAGVHVLLVRDVRLLQRVRERLAIGLGNALVGAAVDRQHGRLELRRRVDGLGPLR